MSAADRNVRLVRGSDGDVYISVDTPSASVFARIDVEDVESLRESLAEYDETEPEPVDAAAAKGEYMANVLGPER